MKRLSALAPFALALLLALFGRANARNTCVVVSAKGANLVGSNGVVYESSSTGTSDTSVASATDSVKTTAATKAVIHVLGYRRNNGQNTISTKLNGVQMNIATVSISGQFELEIYYATGTMIPSAGTYNIVDVISPSSTGLFTKSLTFKGTASNVSNPDRNQTSNVTTSSVTSSGDSINDMFAGACIVQDATQPQPTLNTPGIVAVSSAAAGGVTGDGGWFFVTYGTFTATSFTENISWSGGRNHMHICAAVNK